ncbi:DUF123 domain-containing protein [archaeon SCG-AAA382B04]|nr:DUF123 domain-containing protein [archaeon SCG-AAA382B04]
MKGIYSLIFDCKGKIEVGSLGEKRFEGTYCYIGSARGSGGIKSRLGRHIDLYKKKRDVRHWHIDYVLPNSQLIGYCFGQTEKDKECCLRRSISYDMTIKGFGSSDCNCSSHLLKINYFKKEKIIKGFRKCEINPKFERIKDDE